MNKTQSTNQALWWILVRPEVLHGIDDNSTLIINFKELLQRGPRYNIHVILWTANPKRAQVLQIGRELFRDKVCLGMPSDDWKIVTGYEPHIAPVDFKVLYTSNNTISLRAYDLPDGKWMNRLFDRLNDYNN